MTARARSESTVRPHRGTDGATHSCPHRREWGSPSPDRGVPFGGTHSPVDPIAGAWDRDPTVPRAGERDRGGRRSVSSSLDRTVPRSTSEDREARRTPSREAPRRSAIADEGDTHRRRTGYRSDPIAVPRSSDRGPLRHLGGPRMAPMAVPVAVQRERASHPSRSPAWVNGSVIPGDRERRGHRWGSSWVSNGIPAAAQRDPHDRPTGLHDPASGFPRSIEGDLRRGRGRPRGRAQRLPGVRERRTPVPSGPARSAISWQRRSARLDLAVEALGETCPFSPLVRSTPDACTRRSRHRISPSRDGFRDGEPLPSEARRRCSSIPSPRTPPEESFVGSIRSLVPLAVAIPAKAGGTHTGSRSEVGGGAGSSTSGTAATTSGMAERRPNRVPDISKRHLNMRRSFR
jgi:hypothetical protein